MDISRPSQAGAKFRKRALTAGSIAVAFVAITISVLRMKPSVPPVDRKQVWIDIVKRGPMVRDVHGTGTLVPEDISWIVARTPGRMNRITIYPGTEVEPDSIIMTLVNPDVMQAAIAADSQLKASEADLENAKVQLERDLLQAESDAASAKAAYEQAKMKAELNAGLFKEGLVSSMDVQLSKVVAEQAETLNKVQQKRYDFQKASIAPQLAVKQAMVDQMQAQDKLRHDDADALAVRAGMQGVLQMIAADVGAQVQPGTNLARVANPKQLKATIQIAETQARDIQIGQPAQIDTHNGIVEGRVSRIDPGVQNGTVTVDVKITSPLPRGARPDLSIDGTIELERLDNVIYVGRPAQGQELGTIGLFRLEEDGAYASRLQVQLGRSSVNTIEILRGLKPGDRVILSDMSQWNATERIRLN